MNIGNVKNVSKFIGKDTNFSVLKNDFKIWMKNVINNCSKIKKSKKKKKKIRKNLWNQISN